MKNVKKIFFISGIVLIGVIFIGTFIFLIFKAQKPPLIYKVISPVMDNIEKVTVANGKIVPRREINIKSGITGIIDTIYIEPGDHVTKGTVMLKIRIVPNQLSLNEANNRLEKARLAYNNAKSDKDQQEKLLNQKLISGFEYNKYQTAFENAALDLETAENNLQLLKEGATKKGGAADSTNIKSTADGTVLEVPVKEGETVVETSTTGIGTTIAVVADMNNLVFEGQIDESEVGKLRIGLELELTIGAIENQAFKAVLEYIAPKGVQQPEGAIQFAFKAAIKPQREYVIRAGYSANAKIILAKREHVLTIQESAILFDKDQKPYVELETGPQTFKRQNIIIGLSDGLKAEVTSGLSIDDKVKDLELAAQASKK